MIKELKKIWYDTLTGPDNKYSRKSLTTFICLTVCIATFIMDGYKWFDVNIELWYGLLGLSGATIGMTVWDKSKAKAE
jgi:hypothetical protein